MPHAVTSTLAPGVTVTEMREAGPARPSLATPTKNVSLRQFQFRESSFFESGEHRISIDDTDDATNVTITWSTKLMWVGEISYIFVGDVGEDDAEGNRPGNGPPPFEPPDVVPDLPGGDVLPRIPLPDGEKTEKE